MKEQKTIFIISGLVMFFSLIVSIILEWRIDFKIIQCLSGHRDFLVNIFLGLAASALLTAMVALITYRVMCKNQLKEFWLSTEKYIQHINLFCFKYFPQNASTLQICYILENSCTLLEEINNLNINYCDQCERLLHLVFISKKSKLSQTIKQLTGQMNSIQMMVSSLMYFNPQMASEAHIYPPSRKEAIINQFRTSSAIEHLKVANITLQNLLGIKTNEKSV